MKLSNEQLIQAEKKIRQKHNLCLCMKEFNSYMKGGKKTIYNKPKQQAKERHSDYIKRIDLDYKKFARNLSYICGNTLCNKVVKGGSLDDFINEWNEFYKANS